MSLLSGRKAYLPLEESRPYKVVLQGWIERVNTDENTKAQTPGFIAFKWQVLEDGRVVTDNRSVPVGTDILASAIINQLKDTSLNAMEQEDLFQMCLDSKTQLDMWVERRSTESDMFTNYHFREFKAKAQATNTTASATNTSSVDEIN